MHLWHIDYLFVLYLHVTRWLCGEDRRELCMGGCIEKNNQGATQMTERQRWNLKDSVCTVTKQLGKVGIGKMFAQVTHLGPHLGQAVGHVGIRKMFYILAVLHNNSNITSMTKSNNICSPLQIPCPETGEQDDMPRSDSKMHTGLDNHCYT